MTFERLLGGDREFGMFGAQMYARPRRHAAASSKPAMFESDCVGPHRPGVGGFHQRDHGRGIDAAGRETRRPVRRRPCDDARRPEQGFQPVGEFACRLACNGIGEARARDRAGVPEAFDTRLAAPGQSKDRTGLELIHALVNTCAGPECSCDA